MGLSAEQLQRVREKATERSQRISDSSDTPSTSLVYIPDGVTKFRPYADKDGEVIRTGFRHKFGNRSINCLGLPACKVCARLKEVSDSWDNAWRFGSQEFSLMYVWIFETSDSSNKYIKLNEPVILMGNARLANEISYQLKDIQSEDLEPEEPSLMWQLRYDREKKNISLGFFSRKATMDPLPESFPPLSQVYYKDGVPPSKEKEAEFLKELENSYTKFLSLSGSESYTPPLPPQDEPKREERSTRASGGKKSDIQRTSANSSKEIPPCFGYHNDSSEDPQCLLCKVENKCEVETTKEA